MTDIRQPKANSDRQDIVSSLDTALSSLRPSATCLAGIAEASWRCLPLAYRALCGFQAAIVKVL